MHPKVGFPGSLSAPGADVAGRPNVAASGAAWEPNHSEQFRRLPQTGSRFHYNGQFDWRTAFRGKSVRSARVAVLPDGKVRPDLFGRSPSRQCGRIAFES
jgi:hypothetical protein